MQRGRNIFMELSRLEMVLQYHICFFADDILLFLRADKFELKYAQDLLLRFSRASGQIVNPLKIGITFSKSISRCRQNDIADLLQMKTMKLSDRYLGVPLFLNRSKVLSFQPLIDQMQRKLDGWKEKLIPQARRAVQIQAVLNSVALYQMSCFPIPNATIRKLNTLQRRYWWGHHPNQKGLNPRAWNKIFLPNRFGGLEFKNLEKFNLALLAKMAWRLVTQPDLLSSRVIKSKYFPKHKPLHAILRRKGTWIWNDICKGLKIVKQYHIWEVVSGEDISIWQDRWIESESQFLQKPTDYHLQDYNQVSQLIDHYNNEWDDSALAELFSQDQIDIIHKIRIPATGTDAIKWSLTTSGHFTTKSTYSALLKAQCNSSQQEQRQWLRVWHLNVFPKFKFFIWKCLHDILPFKSYLYRFGVVSDMLCPLCGLADKTLDHLFYHCDFARAVWFDLCPQVFSALACFHSLRYWIMHWFSSKLTSDLNDLYRIYIIVMWQIWKARCKASFENVQQNPLIVIQRINSQLQYLQQTSIFYQHLAKTSCTVPTNLNRFLLKAKDLAQLSDYSLIFGDASMRNSSFIAGCGAVWYKPNGIFEKAKCWTINASSVIAAEAQAITHAMEWAQQKQLQRIIVVSDNQALVNAINGAACYICWTHISYVTNCKNDMSSFHSPYCKYVPRKLNRAADALARLARKSNVIKEWELQPPNTISLFPFCNF
ncbi:uncharacterized protein LOC113351990 [Papaver somniferum]|uniref:uncharacterized protein LOC113351990 n=1 Tax=Papaver somniferum TaxID=3469 RepID=UPI000E6FE7C1|nr:uncharacterized protein LOC113351990 [Papaver somniferum]